jgi:hypothetical protein
MKRLLTSDTVHRLCSFIWITNNLRMKERLIKAGSLHCLRYHTVDRYASAIDIKNGHLLK